MSRKVVSIIVGVLVVAFVWVSCGPTYAARRNISREVDGGVVLRTWQRRDFNVCEEYNNGVLSGWIVKVTRRSWPTGTTLWRFGEWAGAFCSNRKHVWDVRWGGEPDGYANSYLLWHWAANDTRLVQEDNVGDYRIRKWRTRFYVFGGYVECHPWLYVGVGTYQRINMNSDRGC